MIIWNTFKSMYSGANHSIKEKQTQLDWQETVLLRKEDFNLFARVSLPVENYHKNKSGTHVERTSKDLKTSDIWV